MLTKLNIAIQIQMSQTICSKFEKLNYTFNTHHFKHKELTKYDNLNWDPI